MMAMVTGNRTKVEEHDGDYIDYTYDDLYRLTRETRKDDQAAVEYDYSYEFDAVGNRTKKTDEETEDETSYTYNSMNQMTAAGNMATKVANQQTTSYTWDFRNKTLEVDFPTGDDVSLRYCGDGNRYRKEVGTATTKFLFGGRALAFELDGSDTVQAGYRRRTDGVLLAMERGTTLSTYHFDALESTRALTSAAETITDTYEYDAWGEETTSTGATQNPFRAFSAADEGNEILPYPWSNHNSDPPPWLWEKWRRCRDRAYRRFHAQVLCCLDKKRSLGYWTTCFILCNGACLFAGGPPKVCATFCASACTSSTVAGRTWCVDEADRQLRKDLQNCWGLLDGTWPPKPKPEPEPPGRLPQWPQPRPPMTPPFPWQPFGPALRQPGLGF